MSVPFRTPATTTAAACKTQIKDSQSCETNLLYPHLQRKQEQATVIQTNKGVQRKNKKVQRQIAQNASLITFYDRGQLECT